MVAAVLADPVADAASGGRVGPNAVIQLIAALRGAAPTSVDRVFERAGLRPLLSAPPTAMVDEVLPARLFQALWRELPAADAARVARDAGRRTADYVIANRIPRPARAALRVAPRRLGATLLLGAIRRSAWTFVGSGRCETSSRPAPVILLKDNPIPMPELCWQAASFERMFGRLVAPGARVRSFPAARDGDADRFEIDLWPERAKRTSDCAD